MNSDKTFTDILRLTRAEYTGSSKFKKIPFSRCICLNQTDYDKK